jgi:hypothetical protein
LKQDLPVMDDAYFQGNYNTQLQPHEEQQFAQWAQSVGKDVNGETIDYDLRGAWKGGAAAAGNGHFPDTYKKPNHPTFSDQSVYHGAQAPWGGSWVGGTWNTQGQQPTYTPSNVMLQRTHPVQFMQKYMQEREPGVRLIIPQVPQ